MEHRAGPMRPDVTSVRWRAARGCAGGVADPGITGLVLQESPVTITEICARALCGRVVSS